MTQQVAEDGGEQPAGPYLVGYAVEKAEGMYEWAGGELVWRDPGEDTLHVEIAVRDGVDGRFVPGVRVTAMLIDEDGNDLGEHEHPLLWHPMIYHYGRNWKVPGDGVYSLRVRVDPPLFMRHDQVNGRRFTEVVEVQFSEVRMRTGQDCTGARSPRLVAPCIGDQERTVRRRAEARARRTRAGAGR